MALLTCALMSLVLGAPTAVDEWITALEVSVAKLSGQAMPNEDNGTVSKSSRDSCIILPEYKQVEEGGWSNTWCACYGKPCYHYSTHSYHIPFDYPRTVVTYSPTRRTVSTLPSDEYIDTYDCKGKSKGNLRFKKVEKGKWFQATRQYDAQGRSTGCPRGYSLGHKSSRFRTDERITFTSEEARNAYPYVSDGLMDVYECCPGGHQLEDGEACVEDKQCKTGGCRRQRDGRAKYCSACEYGHYDNPDDEVCCPANSVSTLGSWFHTDKWCREMHKGAPCVYDWQCKSGSASTVVGESGKSGLKCAKSGHATTALCVAA